MWTINHFHLQLLIIELLFCAKLERKSHFLLRFLPLAACYAALPQLLPGGFAFAPLTIGWLPLGFWFTSLLSALLIWACFRIHFRQLVLYYCISNTLQHMLHCLCRMLLDPLLPDRLSVSYNIAHVLALIIFCLIIVFFLRKPFLDNEAADIRNGMLLTFAVISTVIIYVVSMTPASADNVPFGMTFNDFFACLMILFIMLDAFRLKKAEQNKLILEQLLSQEQEQLRIRNATADVINRKCHDLRHQISALRYMSEAEKEKSISELEQAVMIYDCFPKTGHAGLDIILAEKNLLAEKNSITIHSIIDGSRLGFMTTEDMYSLIGNALDNAIEAAAQENEDVPRIITVYGAAKGKLYSIHVDNPCSREPIFIDGLPQTNKQDVEYHGYGSQSMRYICEKYNGVMKARWEDNVFNLDILLQAERN